MQLAASDAAGKNAMPEITFPSRPLLCSSVKSAVLAVEGDGMMRQEFLYRAGFDARHWSGTLEKVVIDPEAGRPPQAGAAVWEAGAILTGINGRQAEPLPDRRRIYTARTHGGTHFDTVPFIWNELDAEQKAWLDRSPAKRIHDGMGAARLDYLRGARELEAARPNGVFRRRSSVLGDIVHSVPVVGEALSGNTLHDRAPAIEGASKNKSEGESKSEPKRGSVVYVGANDGMLHAFDAQDGKELFAYVPNALFPALPLLTAPDYQHRSFVDGAITVAQARLHGKWKMVLAAGMGSGAQGLFVLDVSDPANFASNGGALFEFTDKDDPDMGNLLSAPSIARFRTGMRNGVPQYKYFIVASGGYNNYGKDGAGRLDGKASGALFLLSLDKEAGAKWELNVNYYKFTTPLADVLSPNGLGPPALVAGSDGAVNFAYAGDLQGNMWRFDFRGYAPWRAALKGAAGIKPLIVASDDAGKRQPIVMQPRVAFAPQGGYLVLFGTGKFLEESDTDPRNFKVQSFYGVLDTTLERFAINGREELAVRTLGKASSQESNALEMRGQEFTYRTKESKEAGKKGWYVDFQDSHQTGERSIASPTLVSGMLFFHTLIPDRGSCSAGGGRTYMLDALTGLPSPGGATGVLKQSGLSLQPGLLAVRSEPASINAFGRRMIKKRHFPLAPGAPDKQEAAGGASLQPPAVHEKNIRAGRLSWREIINWQEMHDAAASK